MTSGYAIATLMTFVLSVFFAIQPLYIPTPHPLPRIPLNLTTTSILSIALLWAAQCIDSVVIRNGIVGTDGIKPYNILILSFSLAYMAVTLDITGVLQAAAFWVNNKGTYNGWRLYLYFYIMLTLLSILLGNNPTILSATTFLVYYTEVVEFNPTAWIMAEFAVANTASMVLFVGNPTNMIICEGLGINNAAFTAYTVLPFIACNIFCFAALAFQFKKHIPRTLTRVAYRDPLGALLDPVGAWIGSMMLCAALILCLIVSLFGIEVWMISLPFAVGKLLFDLMWDHYRYSCGIPMLGHGFSAEEKPDKKPMAVRHHLSTDDTFTHHASPTGVGQPASFPPDEEISQPELETIPQSGPKTSSRSNPAGTTPYVLRWYQSYKDDLYARLQAHFPTYLTALPRLLSTLVFSAFSQFILIEALDHQGWVNVFATWLVRASHKQMHPTIWLVGVLGIILCNISGTNIGATILLTKVIRAATLPYHSHRAAAIALAVASNIGAVNLTFSASLAGLLWQTILKQKNIHVKQRDFAFLNLLPLLVMAGVGLGTVSAEMTVLFGS